MAIFITFFFFLDATLYVVFSRSRMVTKGELASRHWKILNSQSGTIICHFSVETQVLTSPAKNSGKTKWIVKVNFFC